MKECKCGKNEILKSLEAMLPSVDYCRRIGESGLCGNSSFCISGGSVVPRAIAEEVCLPAPSVGELMLEFRKIGFYEPEVRMYDPECEGAFSASCHKLPIELRDTREGGFVGEGCEKPADALADLLLFVSGIDAEDAK